MTDDTRQARSTTVDRRQVLGRTAAAAGTALLPGAVVAPWSAAAADEIEGELVFACDGGGTQRIFEEHFFPEFSKRYGGVKFTYVAGQPADSMAKLRVQKARPTIDAVWLAGGVTFQAIDEKLVTDLDQALVPNLKAIPPAIATETAAAPVGITTCGLIYNSAVFAKQGFAAPTSWWDMWDPKFKGHVGTYSINVTSANALLTLIAKTLSGDWKNVDAAFAKFKELRPNFLDTYTSAGAYETAIQQGDVWIGMNTAVRALQLKNAGQPIGWVLPKEGVVGYQTWVGVVANAPHPKAAHAWANYLMSVEAQQKMVELIGYNPVNPQARTPAALADYFPPTASIFVPDWRYMSGKLASFVERWNREVER